MNGKNAKAMRREADRAIRDTADIVAPALEKVALFAKGTEEQLGARLRVLEAVRGRGLRGRLLWLLTGR